MSEPNLDKVYDKILQFVKDMKPAEIHERKDEHAIIIPIKFEVPSKLTLNLLAEIRLNPRWVMIKCLLMLYESIPKQKGLLEKLYEGLLHANFKLAEVTYSIDGNKNIFSECDMPLDTDFGNFKSELDSVMFAIEYFFNEVIPKVSNEIKKEDTYKKSMYT